MADYMFVLECLEMNFVIASDLRRSRVFRDRANPFDLSDTEFILNFRLSKPAAYFLIQKLRSFLTCRSRARTALPPEIKVLCALNFFATGSYQRSIANHLVIAVSQPSTSKVIRQVAHLIVRHLMSQWVQFSLNRQTSTQVKAGFQEKFNFPGVIGAIDCTHVAIVAPSDSSEGPGFVYVNRKGFHSINAQIICDSDLRILNVNAKFPGSTHDSFIWKTSAVRTAIMQYHEVGSWLLGDAGYPLEPWLMTPVHAASAQSVEDAYNRRHISTRNCVERCIGVLKSRFRCLLHSRELHYSPQAAGQIINACCVLHNICRHFNIEDPPVDDEPDPWGPIFPQDSDEELRRRGERTRINLIATRFNV